MAELRAPEQNRLLGQLANMLRATEGDAPEFLPKGLDVMGLVRQLMLPSAETVEKLSYGDPLFRMPTQSNIPITADREYLADIAGMIPFGAPAARPSARAMQDLVRQIQTEPPTGAVNMTTKPMGQGLLAIKQDAKKLSEKEFLDKYVTETLPEHLESNNFPEGVRQGKPHEFLPPEMLDPSEWDDWSDRSMSGAAEKINQFRQSLREGAEFPPVLIHSQKGAFPYVEDGHHRMAAYLDEGYKSVPVSFDMSSLIKIWKEENQSPKKVSDIYKEYTQGLLSSQPKSAIINEFFSKAQKFPSEYTDIAPRQTTVQVNQLIPTQKTVNPAAVDAYKFGQGSMGDLPADVVFDTKTNQYLIVDGHHRIASMIESGFDKIPVQIIGEK